MSRWPNKYVIGLTGNIAVGKSVVRQMLQHLGAYTIDADGLAHQAMSPGAPAYQPIIDKFGQIILNPDKTINRTALANVVFTNPAALAQLEALTHPIIGQAINTLISRAKQPIIVIEAIKLIEGEIGKAVDSIWVVNAKPQSQYTRLITKRKMSEAEAKQRMLSQGGQAEKLKAANVIIQNEGNVEETWKQVQAEWNKIMKSAAPPAPAQAAPAPQPKPTASAQAAPKPAAAPAAQPKPAVQAPAAPAAEEGTKSIPADVDISGVAVKRGMPSNAEVIANFINTNTGQTVERMDVIMSFGQKSYLLADAGGSTVGVVGWQVENLITRVDELYLAASAPKETTIYALVVAIEEASKELQSEVSFVFLPNSAGDELVNPFLNSGYELTTVKEIKIPAWREAVQEVINDNTKILTKKLRKDRVLKPI